MSVFIKLLNFLTTKKKYWLYPVLLLLIIVSAFTVFSQGPIVPWIYAIF